VENTNKSCFYAGCRRFGGVDFGGEIRAEYFIEIFECEEK
jgi:hypothetical protein